MLIVPAWLLFTLHRIVTTLPTTLVVKVGPVIVPACSACTVVLVTPATTDPDALVALMMTKPPADCRVMLALLTSTLTARIKATDTLDGTVKLKNAVATLFVNAVVKAPA